MKFPTRALGRALVTLVALSLLLAWACGDTAAPAPKVLVLGIDGMDPRILRDMMARGELPNLARLAEEGGFRELATITPPQSPVAWATMLTGLSPGGTGIYDFIHRNPVTMLPHLSTAQVEEPERVLELGDWRIPLESGSVRQRMHGGSFWQSLDAHGVPATVLKIPSNFPPLPTDCHTLSGMGTPDVRGTYGIFHFYTDDRSRGDGDLPGGRVHQVDVVEGHVQAELPGPQNTLHAAQPATSVPLEIRIDPTEPVARIDIAGEQILLREGEWSRWVRVRFEMIPWLASVGGIVRFHLARVHPSLELYASPVNLDPEDPALPISTPEGWAAEIAGEIGPFYTQGMPEDTKALSAGVLDDAGFMEQAALILEEENQMLDFGIERFEEGFLFVYYSIVDQVSHAMWRAMDPDHPLWTPELGEAFGDAIPWTYREVDAAVGRALDRVGPETTVIVMSDHGFAPFYREMNLNTWLVDEGYLALKRGVRAEDVDLFQGVDWGRTRAYAMGLNGLYINRIGRESQGTVLPGAQADRLIEELRGKLLALRDPETGQRVIGRLYRSREVYEGPWVEEAPDLVVGYARTYRTSDDSALGTLSRPVLRDRTDTWSGDHLMETASVPGVLLANRPLPEGDWGLEDMAPTILSLYGIEPGPDLIGRAIPLSPSPQAQRR